MSTWMLIFMSTVMGIISQTMMKYGMNNLGPVRLSGANAPLAVWRIARSPLVIGGLALYGVGTFFWLVTLSRIDLSLAYPFATLSHVLLFLVGWLVLREKVSPLRGAGVLLVCAGMLLVAVS
jgi:multidrug transporter EmrE-like cation transporter